MAEKFPQFEESQPVFNPIGIKSKAEGYEAFAKTLGQLSVKAADKVEKIEDSASNAMYMSSLANIDQLKFSAQELMATDPSNAMKYASTMRDSVQKVQSLARVNSEDRGKLNRYAAYGADSIELEATKANVKQAQLATGYEFWKNAADHLNILQTSASDPEKFEKYKDNLLQYTQSAVRTGAITPLQAGNFIKMMGGAVDIAHHKYIVAANADQHTAQDLHTALSNPFDKNKTKNIDYPADENTLWMTKHYASEATFKDVKDGLQDHAVPDFAAMKDFTAPQVKEIEKTINGIRAADGIIDSNSSYPKIQARINDLKGRDGYADQAERKALLSYVDDWNNGNSQQLMARTAIGGRIIRDFTDRQAFLDNKLKQTNPKDTDEINNINSEIAKNKNDYANNGISYAIGHHFPVVHPIPYTDVLTVKNGFNYKGNPSDNASKAYTTFKQYSPTNQIYLADQMKDPLHKMVLQTVATGGKRNSDQDYIEFIAANQNRNYKEISKETGENVPSYYLKNSIQSKLVDAMKIISAQNDAIDSTTYNANLVQSGINYAKFLSEKKGDYNLKEESIYNSISNVTDATNFIKRSYNVMSGANYIVNKNQVHLEPSQMDMVAQYAINEGNKELRKGISEASFIQLNHAAPLFVTVTPANILIAKNANGTTAFSRPLTDSLVSLAIKNIKADKEEKARKEKQLFQNAIEHPFFLQTDILGE